MWYLNFFLFYIVFFVFIIFMLIFMVWGEEEFEYCVSEGWYRDVMFCGENFNVFVFE